MPSPLADLETRLEAVEARLSAGSTDKLPPGALDLGALARQLDYQGTQQGNRLMESRTVGPREMSKLPYAHLKRTTAQNIPSAAWTLITHTVTTADNYLMANAAFTRLYARIPGIYLATGGVQFDTVDTALVGYAFAKNAGGTLTAANIVGGYHGHGSAAKAIAPRSAELIRLESGDYLEAYAYQDSGIGQNTVADANVENYTTFRLMWMGNYE